MQRYNPKEIEPKWQKFWEENKTFAVFEDSTKKKFYSLIEFPYPSGAGLHVGHPRPFTAMDVVSRKKKMDGYNVLYPIGFDAFGLPTENYAIKTGRPPAEVTKENISNFTRQLKSFGYVFDWDRCVDTTDPNYYKWTQWIFLELFKNGLAYKTNIPINWCLNCKIGLANEEIVSGACERCGGPVEKRDKEQWMLRITDYADSLLKGLETVDYIPQAATQQRNWIGRSEGAEIKWSIYFDKLIGNIDTFTTRPDTIFGAMYLVVSPEHPLLTEIIDKIENSDEVVKYIQGAKLKSDLERTELQKEKTGVELKGVYAINPVNNEKVPVWVADYVLISYGTGAIMAVPSHDERDFEFSKKYNLPIKQVVAPYICLKSFAPIDNKKTQTRNVITAIIKHKTTGEYLVQERADGGIGFTGGGIDNNETSLDALKREIKEETGFTEIVSISKIIEMVGHGYKPKKNINCFDPDTVYFVEVDGEPSFEISDEDKNLHKIVWKKENEVETCINLEHHSFAWQCYKTKLECFSDEGVSINSDFLNGLKTQDAIQKITKYLEDKNLGKKKINYKLRDWVFSRQRYWGEPIPLVYCESCSKRPQKVLLVHGFSGSAENNGLPWLKGELENAGFEVFSPSLSNSSHPTIDSWVTELLPYIDELGERDIVVGYSLGANAAARALDRSCKKIGSLIFVAGAVEKKSESDWERFTSLDPNDDLKSLRIFWEAPLDWASINNLVEYKLSILSTDDPYISIDGHRELFGRSWRYRILENRKHINDSIQPELLQEILKKKFTGWVPLDINQLPLELPAVKKYEPTDTGESPLSTMSDWVSTACPSCNGVARRETDTMPNWAGSSWYFLRYIDPHNANNLADDDKLNYWGQVDWYNGGMEHVVLHLLYSRFWNQFLFDIGVVPHFEPYAKRTSHGMILAKGGEKMSKSKGNVVNPDEMVEQYGADSLRTYIMFMGPFDQAVEWDTNGLVGVRRFLDRIWGLQSAISSDNTDSVSKEIVVMTHKTIKKVSEDIESMRFNTAIAQLMEFTNLLVKEKKVSRDTFEILICLLSPFAPHISEELWSNLGCVGSVSLASWPTFDENLCIDEKVFIGVQINGKVRDTIEVELSYSEEQIRQLVLSREKIKKYLNGQEPKKIIIIKGKIVNVVV